MASDARAAGRREDRDEARMRALGHKYVVLIAHEPSVALQTLLPTKLARFVVCQACGGPRGSMLKCPAVGELHPRLRPMCEEQHEDQTLVLDQRHHLEPREPE